MSLLLYSQISPSNKDQIYIKNSKNYNYTFLKIYQRFSELRKNIKEAIKIFKYRQNINLEIPTNIVEQVNIIFNAEFKLQKYN